MTLTSIAQATSKLTYIHQGHRIKVLDVEDPICTDLQKWIGTCSYRAVPNDDIRAAHFSGLFNEANHEQGVIVVTEHAYANACLELRQLIDLVLDRRLPVPVPLRDHYDGIFVGELIVDGYRRTEPFTGTVTSDLTNPEQPVPGWLVRKTKKETP